MSRGRDTISSTEAEASGESTPAGTVGTLRRDRGNRRRRRIVMVVVVLSAGTLIQWHRDIGLAVAGRWFAARAGAPSVNVREAMEMIEKQDARVLDVRDLRESAISHLQGAERFALEDLEAGRLPDSARRDRPIITYCTIGSRSGAAARILMDKGFDARSLRGGILALARASAPLVAANGPTREVHTWSKGCAWLLASDHDAIWDQAGP